MKLLNFAIIKITLYLIIGILIAHFSEIGITIVLTAIFLLLSGLLICIILEKRQLVKSYGFDLVVFFLFIGFGILTYHIHDQKNFRNHYTNHVDSNQDPGLIHFRIREILKPGINHEKYIVDVHKINNQNVTGKALLNVRKDSMTVRMDVGANLVTTATLQELRAPLNPDQFDYKAYLQKQYVYHQIFTNDQELLVTGPITESIFSKAFQLRKTINARLQSYNFKPDELSLINALLLGQRQDINPEIYNSYSKAGAVHILAVSGLHVGIVLLLLNWVLKPLVYFKNGKVIKTVLLVLMLWSFAIIAGLSASVTRAVMMFSVVAIGMNLKRPSNIYNTLATSMFLLLLFKPSFLFDVGFQMSYLAVFAIVTLQPPLVKLWRPKFYPVRKLWEILTVTVAAQLGVVPISLFYFHQFPGLFFISNLVIIPFLGIILGLGIVVIFMALFGVLPQLLADLYGGIISSMNNFVKWVSLQERYVLSDISFSQLQVLATYLMLVTGFLYLRRRNFTRTMIVLFSVIIFQGVLIFEKQKNQTSQMVVFHKNRSSILGYKNGTLLTLSHTLDKKFIASDYTLKNYKINNDIREIKEEVLADIYQMGENHLLIIDSLGIYQLPASLKADYILLRNSPKINLARLLDTIKPKIIIADGSNYKSYLQRWEATCLKQNVPFHQTGREGAFIVKN